MDAYTVLMWPPSEVFYRSTKIGTHSFGRFWRHSTVTVAIVVLHDIEEIYSEKVSGAEGICPGAGLTAAI